MSDAPKLYKLDDSVLFWQDKSGDIFFHCATHKELELTMTFPLDSFNTKLYCPLCGVVKEIDMRKTEAHAFLTKQAESLLNADSFKNAELVRIDDYYVPELRVEMKGDKTTTTNRTELPSDYKVVCDIKKDKDDDTIIMLQVFKGATKKGAQIFVKPEKKQLTFDHNKNPDPATVLSEIKVTLQDGRVMTHKYK